jgi:hypothetical protein
MRVLTVLALAVLSSTDPTPFEGRTRDEIVKLLGRPSSSSREADGSERLVYKLRRLEEGVPSPDMAVVTVPEHGTLVRQLPPEPPLEQATVSPALDEYGRPILTQELEVTFGEDGLEKPEKPSAGPRLGKKVRLTLELDASGKVRSWTVAPK